MECHVGHGCPGKDAEDGVDVDLPLGWQSFTAVRRRVRAIAEAMTVPGRDAQLDSVANPTIFEGVPAW